MRQALNVLGGPLEPCGMDPVTGYYRTGSCATGISDTGSHVVCARLTAEFLEFTVTRGNDLVTPTEHFPGLKPGDRWCLCATRWRDAYAAGMAPQVVLEATHLNTLGVVTLDQLREFAVTA